MTITQIENNITKLLKNFSKDSFVFDLLQAYGEPNATIARIKKGDLNQLNTKGELTHRKKLFFKEVTDHLHSTIDTLRSDSVILKQKPRFIIVTDYETLLAYDTKTTDTLDIKLMDLVKHYDFFLPLTGMEKQAYVDENPADVRASNKLAKLYDEILKTNPTQTHEEVHALNVFLTRLLFCYFAEDSNIFENNLFTNSISNHTQVDGSDLDSYLERLFDVFNADDKNRDSSLPKYLKVFPYVNGELFKDSFPLPKFTTKSRNLLIEIGKLKWSEINPDIFGSMIQAVVTPEHRGDMGMHYTSVPNIMKVMQPLFLDELYEEFARVKSSKKRLQALHLRITNLKIFDPACGSGNFLIIAYKELRRLEMKTLSAIDDLSTQKSFTFSEIKLTQFYGIELDDFAHEVAILSLWLAEHQMNLEFYKAFGRTSPSLPLQDGGNIVHSNATRVDWEEVCPKVDGDEIYILGNPPYQGSGKQNPEQKEDMDYVFNQVKSYKKLDYITCWFYKGAKYIQGIKAKYAFVTTNSISQGEQVGILWTYLFNMNLEIYFAHQSFKWKNNAKDNAGVSVVIIGLRNISKDVKYIYQNKIKHEVKNINAYLINGNNIIVNGRRTNLSNLPEMSIGSKASDNGYLTLSETEKNDLNFKNPNSEIFIKKYTGNKDFMNKNIRYCIWIDENNKNEAYKIEEFKKRFESVKQFRLASKKKATRRKAQTPYRFDEAKYQDMNSIIVPQTGSETREYLPIGFMDKNTVISNGLRIIYSQEPYLFGILSSKMHIVWVKAVAGRMKTDMQYSNTICYNTFPFPKLTKQQKEEVEKLSLNISDTRENHSEETLVTLYNTNTMPADLKEAHYQVDLAIEKCYRNKPFKNDEERLEYLFKLYEEMIKDEGK